MKLDGKKKWTATLITFATAILGALVTTGVIGQEAADSAVQATSILAPLAMGAMYNLMQGQQDKKKEDTKKADIEKQTEELKLKEEEVKTVARTQEEKTYPAVPDFKYLYNKVKVSHTDSQGVINWFQVYDNVESWLESERLDQYHPDARLPLAREMITVAIDAKRNEFEVATGVTPEPYTNKPEDEPKVEVLEKRIRDAKPGCEAISAADRKHIIDLGNLYEWQQNIDVLQGKSVKWDLGYNTVQILGTRGIKAIG
jgi:hypothetical protein